MFNKWLMSAGIKNDKYRNMYILVNMENQFHRVSV